MSAVGSAILIAAAVVAAVWCSRLWLAARSTRAAFVALKSGAHDEAIGLANAALAYDGEDVSALRCRAAAQHAKHCFDGALRDYAKCLELEGANEVVRAARGICFYDSGARDAAFADLERIPLNNFASARAVVVLASLLRDRGDVTAAAHAYERALELAPREVSIRQGFANVLLHAGFFAEAREQLSIALQIGGALPDLLCARAEAASGLGDHTAAVTDASWALAYDEHSVRARTTLGVALARRNLLEEALTTLERGAPYKGTAEHFAKFYGTRGSMRLLAGKADAAFEDLTIAIDYSPADAALRINRGHALVARNRYVEAMREFELAIAVGDNSAVSRVSLGSVLLRLGAHENATAALTDAILIEPSNATAWGLRAVARAASGDFDMARLDAKRSVELDATCDIAAELCR